MLINMRNAMLSGGWKNPYITDGLVAMWDAEWNAGGGRHTYDRILTNLVTGETVAIPETGYYLGDNYIISDAGSYFVLGNLSGNISTPCTLTSVGCCMTLPTNKDNTSGTFGINGIGSLFMWRLGSGAASGVVGGSLFQTDNKVHYYGSPSNTWISMREANAEIFGALRSRAAVIQSPVSSSGLTYYYNGTAKNGTNTMGYTDSWSSPSYNVSSPTAASCQVKWCNIAIYSRALTAAEIAANYAIDKARFNLP